MADRNSKLGGTDFTEEGLKPSDMNDTNSSIIDLAGVGVAQLAYQTLKQSGTFDNQDFLLADRFTDSDGVNNTVNTGTTTAIYDTTNDNYNLLQDNTETSNTDATGSDGNNSTVTTSGTIDSSKGYFSIIKAFVADVLTRTVTVTVKKGATTVASDSQVLNSFQGVFSFNFNKSDYSQLLENGDSYSVELTDSQGRLLTGTGTAATFSGTYFSYTNMILKGTSGHLTFQEFNLNSSGILVIDTNTKTLDGNEKSIIVYGDTTLPTNTNITVDISDGTTTLSTQNLNEVIGISTLSSGTLKLTFNLSTTDTDNTPELRGYGVYTL